MEREILVEIGPFKEYEGIQAMSGDGYGIKFVSNGKIDTLKIKAHIEKSLAGAGNTAQIYIGNLSKETREALNTPGMQVSVYTRTDDGDYNMAFFGGLSGAFTERFGTDLRTRLMCWSASSALYKESASVSYTKDVPVKKAVVEIAQKIPGVVVDEKKINVEGKFGEGGWSYIGSVPQALTNLSIQYGFSWSIQDGVFQAIDDGTGEKTAIRLTPESGLIKVSPRFSGITQVQVGVDIYSQYVPGIKPGQIVSIESDLHSDKLNGEYKVHTLDFDLCPKETNEAWNMHVAFFFKEGTDG